MCRYLHTSKIHSSAYSCTLNACRMHAKLEESSMNGTGTASMNRTQWALILPIIANVLQLAKIHSHTRRDLCFDVENRWGRDCSQNLAEQLKNIRRQVTEKALRAVFMDARPSPKRKLNTWTCSWSPHINFSQQSVNTWAHIQPF